MDRGAWPATVHGVAKGWTQLSTQTEHTQQPHLILTLQLKVSNSKKQAGEKSM